MEFVDRFLLLVFVCVVLLLRKSQHDWLSKAPVTLLRNNELERNRHDLLRSPANFFEHDKREKRTSPHVNQLFRLDEK